jgi:hypothetical protein
MEDIHLAVQSVFHLANLLEQSNVFQVIYTFSLLSKNTASTFTYMFKILKNENAVTLMREFQR